MIKWLLNMVEKNAVKKKTAYLQPVNKKHLSRRKKVTKRTNTVVQHSKKVAKKGTRNLKKVSKNAVVGTRNLSVAGARKSKRAAIVFHENTMKKPHVYMQSNWQWYARWHAWPKHQLVQNSVFSIYVVIIAFAIFVNYRLAFAADQTDIWDFSSPSNYTIDPTIELSGNSARLKAQNYVSDANTMALFHLDESSGSTADDDSLNNNDAATQSSPSWVAGKLNGGLSLNGSTQFASATDSSSLSLVGNNTVEAWTKFGSTFNSSSSNNRQTVVDKGSYSLYYDEQTGKATYELANAGVTSWTQRAGNDINRSWDLNGKQDVRAQVSIGSDVYAGLGTATSDAEVWKWDGSVWAQIGGDGRNSSWAVGTYESVRSLAVEGTTLYAGLGDTAGDGEVWSCDTTTNCISWTKIGGDGLNSGWLSATYETVDSMAVVGGSLYAGLGASAQDAEVWRWNGSSWTKIGGDGVNPGGGVSWTAADNIETVFSMTTDGNDLYVGLGASANDAEVWRFRPGTNAWTKLGGDSVNPGGGASWGANYEYVLSLNILSGNLYAGLGLTADDAEVWRLNLGTNTWTKIGGDTLNSSWASSTFEGVYSLANDGTNIYAGLGSSTGDAEVWRWNGSTWSKLGGDSVNTSWATGSVVWSMTNVGTTVFVGQSNNSTGNAEMWTVNGTTWTRNGGMYINKSWGYFGTENVEVMTPYNGKLYAALGNNTAGDATVWEYDGTTWRIVGGQGIDGSWAHSLIENVYSMVTYKGNLYVGTGLTAGDGDVWRYNGSSWTQVGGDGLNSGWSGAGYEGVYSLGVYNGNLIAGLGASAQDAEVYSYNGTSWSKIGGDGVASSWSAASNIEVVNTISVYAGNLYVGLGNSAGDGDVWRYNGTAWLQVGGDGLNSSWPVSTYENVNSMSVYDNKLVVGLGDTTGDAEVWTYSGTAWSQIGGDGLNAGFGGASGYDYERVRSLTVYNGNLYAATGSDTGDGDVWQWNGTAWSLIGGHGVNASWDINTAEDVFTLTVYKGKLYAGTGFSTNVDAAVYSYGNNGFLQSSTTSQDTNWHHIAASYDGSTMRLYIDGTLDASASIGLTMPDTSNSLMIGNDLGSYADGIGTGHFDGQLDEIRISNNVRTGFTTKPFATGPQTMQLANAVRKNGVLGWESFATNETTNGGTITYRLSDNEGSTWKYWDGSAWVVSSSTNQANSAAVINSAIASFPASFSGLQWQAILDGDGDQQVTLNSVSIGLNYDADDPSSNAANVKGYKTNGGSEITSNSWTNGASPYFSWDAASDAGSGIKGYCLYLGTSSSANPVTTKGLLGTSPVNTGGNCQFMVSTTSIDLATVGNLASPLTTSNSPYYLNVKAIDNAGNIFPTNDQFQFRFDNTAPSNPGFISAPSGFINTKAATFTWPTSGGQEPSDANSDIAGMQYKINNSSWYGDAHIGTGDMTDLLTNDGVYATVDPPDYDNIQEGINTVYFRTWDNAGNVTSTYVSAALKVNTSGAPNEPQNVSASPSSNTTNSFAFDWDAPSTFVGNENNLTYCYTINVTPSVSNCTFTSAGVTSLGSGPYATQPGVNTFYVVARDESSSINYANFASVNFSANTPSPGIPLNVDIVDVSIKTTSNWRLALTWEQPTYVGAGIASYKVYRSIDNSSFSFIGSSSSTTYIDANLSQQIYYYKVRACDSTNNCGADTSSVNLLPTGKFTTPSTLTSQPTATNITTKKARINWTTDRTSDSKISIGTTSGSYSPSEVGNSDQVTSHSIDLDNLAAGTTYYYKAKWTDEDGNTGSSQEFSFTTSPAPQLKEVETLSTTLAGATVRFTSREAVKVNIYYGQSESFGGVKSINTSITESTYSFSLDGLADGTKYFYKLSSFDSEGNEYEGNIFSFSTPPRPRISNLRFQPIQGEPTSTQKITWNTNVPTSSNVTYGKINNAGIEVSDSVLKVDHEIVIKDLEDDSEYFIVTQGRDKDGNLSTSDRQTFKTALDTRPPRVRDITVEVSIKGTGAEARGQVVVSWRTDEPSTSQVAYAEGSDAVVFNNKSALDSKLTTDHLVIVSDLPTSKLFSIKPLSKDKAGNEAGGDVQSAIVGKASDSVLTIILNTLQKIFGV